jgi:hypothetical protein
MCVYVCMYLCKDGDPARVLAVIGVIGRGKQGDRGGEIVLQAVGVELEARFLLMASEESEEIVRFEEGAKGLVGEYFHHASAGARREHLGRHHGIGPTRLLLLRSKTQIITKLKNCNQTYLYT